MKIIGIIVAGGSSTRFGGATPKQYELLNGITIFEKSIIALKSSSFNVEIIAVIRPEDLEIFKKYKLDQKVSGFCFGGSTRGDSVHCGLMFAKKFNPEYVLIHDACRPFVSPCLIDSLINELNSGEEASCPAIEVTETIKRCNKFGVELLDRNEIIIIQTPQAFNYNKILETALKNSFQYTDETSLFEASGGKVKYIKGEKRNIKITRKEDCMNEIDFRVGTGFDAHKFAQEQIEDGFIVLGGVKIPFNRRILAHSDGDVLVHALVDALLGAIGEGDIGDYFPANNPKWKNADSMIFLKQALDMIGKKNAVVNNIDITVICEKPKLSEFKQAIKINIANITNLSVDRICVKATTTEKMGFTGREEGIAVMASATVRFL